jgi:hypothetical protein
MEPKAKKAVTPRRIMLRCMVAAERLSTRSAISYWDRVWDEVDGSAQHGYRGSISTPRGIVRF